MDKLEPKPKYANINPTGFNILNFPNKFINGSITDWKGISMAAANKKNKKVLNLDLLLTNIQAAIEAKITISTVLVIVINKELTKE
ncbi:hypothetical protein SDC9_94341 [bioreactor metagenome]|uniref:Uncharacterized protein n=1 Tax=bioreactor metagenome TaxID=1076179 RepID=A0A645A362_9ZZZZ